MTINIESWKIDDEQWMEKRLSEWKEYEFNISNYAGYEKSDFPAYKKYFLTGDDKSLTSFIRTNHSDQRLIEMWLHPSVEPRVYEKIAESIIDIRRVRQTFLRNTPARRKSFKGESHFNGKDFIIYKALFPSHFLREDYPELDDSEFKERAWVEQKLMIAAYLDFFERKEYMPYDYCQVSVPYWKELFATGYQKKTSCEKYLLYFEKLKSNGVNHPNKIKLLEEILSVFNAQDLPELALKEISLVRESLSS